MRSSAGVGDSRGVETGLATVLHNVNVSLDRRHKNLEDNNKEIKFNTLFWR
jgi:hypothetical protein